jgi:hypothetical protein
MVCGTFSGGLRISPLMVNSDFINPIEKLLDLQWCTPELVYTIVDPYGFKKSLFTIASALDFLWGRGIVHCRLLAV